MKSSLLTTLDRTVKLGFIIRIFVTLMVVIELGFLTGINPSRVLASAYSCPPPNFSCYGINIWNGNTYGTSSYIYVSPHVCIGCTPTGQGNGYKLNETIWLFDQTHGGTIEIGYGARDTQYGATWYYYSNYIYGQNQTRIDMNPVPSGDYYNYAGFKMTRNREPTNYILLQYWATVPGSTQRVEVYNPTMGGGDWLANAIDIGTELSGVNNGGSITQSNNGPVRCSVDKQSMADVGW